MAWRAVDSLALREFLGLKVIESPPDHSTISRNPTTAGCGDPRSGLRVGAEADWGQRPAAGQDDRHRCQHAALVHESELARNEPESQVHHLPRAYDDGLPRSAIRLRM